MQAISMATTHPNVVEIKPTQCPAKSEQAAAETTATDPKDRVKLTIGGAAAITVATGVTGALYVSKSAVLMAGGLALGGIPGMIGGAVLSVAADFLMGASDKGQAGAGAGSAVIGLILGGVGTYLGWHGIGIMAGIGAAGGIACGIFAMSLAGKSSREEKPPSACTIHSD